MTPTSARAIATLLAGNLEPGPDLTLAAALALERAANALEVAETIRDQYDPPLAGPYAQGCFVVADRICRTAYGAHTIEEPTA